MRFIINKCIVFDEGASSLVNLETNDEIILTLTASRLLAELLRSPRLALTRDYLSKKVWDDYGQRSSSYSNINQYISILRRNFSALLPDAEIILTIPKVGFHLNPSIMVQIIECETVEQYEEDGALGLSVDDRIKSKVTEVKYFFPIVLFVVSSISFFLAVFFMAIHYNNKFTIHTPLLFRMNEWSCIKDNKGSTNLQNFSLDDIMILMSDESNQGKCQPHNNIYIFKENNFHFVGVTKKQLSYCDNSKGKNNCLNFIFLDTLKNDH